METSEEGPQPGGLGLYKGVPSPLLGHPFQTGLQSENKTFLVHKFYICIKKPEWSGILYASL